MLFNYILGNSLNKESGTDHHKFSKKSLLSFGIIANLALLGYFKYTDFMIDNLNYWIFTEDIPNLNLALPLAISFFTFQQISYLVDSYRQETEEYDFLNYALFVTFFPQLIAGPIVHHKEMMPQFAKTRNKVKSYKNIAIGLFIFSIGLFKKVVIADTFSVWVTAGFDTATTLNFLEAWATSLSYTFQLYFDFSGYTDMAIGVALLFNIKLPINFNSPYKATSIQDFWRRWHITLSRFLKDYIYIPLGGNRKGELRTYTNLMTTFILGGIWHGAGWTFVFWGFLHGFALVIHRAWSKLGIKLWTWLAWLITFNFINIAWIFFRAKDWDSAIKVLSSMFDLSNVVLKESLAVRLDFLSEYHIRFEEVIKMTHDGKDLLNWLIVAFIIILYKKNSNHYLTNFKPNTINMFIMLSIFIYALLQFGGKSEFLYFNF